MNDIKDIQLPLGMEEHGLILRRDGINGFPVTNVPRFVTHHSPTGYEWGYGGSGPADLALNIAEYVVRSVDIRPGNPVDCWDGKTCSSVAWAVHEQLKRDLIVPVPHEGIVYPWDYLLDWFRTVIDLPGEEADGESITVEAD